MMSAAKIDAPNVYCVVVTFNAARWLTRCFGSLLASSSPVKIIAVDNKSTDGTPDRIASEFPSVELVRSDKNLGFGGGNNVGIEMAMREGANYIFLLNQDAWIESDTVDVLLKASVNSPDFGILSPIHLAGNGSDLDRQFSAYLSPPKCNYYNDLYKGELAEVYECLYINAAAWFMTMDCIKIAGLFEPLFFLYGEDFNLIDRIRFHGLKVGIVPATRIIHDRAERKGKKNSVGLALEVRTYLLLRLLKVNGSTFGNLLQACKVFTKHGVSVRTVGNLMKALLETPMLRAHVKSARRRGYLLGSTDL